eukprot:scaffold1319_cov126-Cylindrotheca_fusiformis.AAC.54
MERAELIQAFWRVGHTPGWYLFQHRARGCEVVSGSAGKWGKRVYPREESRFGVSTGHEKQIGNFWASC